MKRYFFDVVSQSRSEYDYRGRELPTPEKANHLAELIALDLELSLEGEWEGYSVIVRDCHGRQYFSKRVRAPELAAA